MSLMPHVTLRVLQYVYIYVITGIIGQRGDLRRQRKLRIIFAAAVIGDAAVHVLLAVHDLNQISVARGIFTADKIEHCADVEFQIGHFRVDERTAVHKAQIFPVVQTDVAFQTEHGCKRRAART